MPQKQDHCPNCGLMLFVREQPHVPHVFHAIMTFFCCCSWWLPVWLLHIMTAGFGVNWHCQRCGYEKPYWGGYIAGACALLFIPLLFLLTAIVVGSFRDRGPSPAVPSLPNRPSPAPAEPTPEPEPLLRPVQPTFESRQWTSTDGGFNGVATFVSRNGGSVRLRTEDGRSIFTRVTALSQADQDYIEQSVQSLADYKQSLADFEAQHDTSSPDD